ncbi:MAG: DNA/RNA non-specific endonuclease [Lacipirellulaceae bacterium]
MLYIKSFMIFAAIGLGATGSTLAQEFLRPVVHSPVHHHLRFEVEPSEHVLQFRAYAVSFDLTDDDNGDGEGDRLGVPNWISYQLDKGPITGSDERPSDWIRVPGLPTTIDSPTDASYANSGYSRGHMCMRSHAQRLGSNANYNSFCLANACPQIQAFNGGHWLGLERLCGLWADEYESLWITCGPIYVQGRDLETIGDGSETKVSIPTGFFKIVARENAAEPNQPFVLAFIYDHDEELSHSGVDVDHVPFLKSIDEIEEKTGLNFFANLSAGDQAAIESQAATALWEWNLTESLSRMFDHASRGQTIDRELFSDLYRVHGNLVIDGRLANKSIKFNAPSLVHPSFNQSRNEGQSSKYPGEPKTGRPAASAGSPEFTVNREMTSRLARIEALLHERNRSVKDEGETAQEEESLSYDISDLQRRVAKLERQIRQVDSPSGKRGNELGISGGSKRHDGRAQRTTPDFTLGSDPAESTIQIGTYNLELLGKSRKKYNGIRRPRRRFEDLREISKRIVDELDLEIVVFQEINTQSGNWKKLKQLLSSEGYEFFEGNYSNREQFVVLAWDADEIEVVDDSLQELEVNTSFSLPGGCSSSGLRKPVAGQFKAGEFDFWVVGVHLKSRVGIGSCPTKVRIEQSKDLVHQIDALISRSHERDVIVAGDFNHHIGHESFDPLTDAGFLFQTQFLGPGSAEGSYIKTWNPHQSDDLIDHIILRYSETREVVRNSTFVYPIESKQAGIEYILNQSDHVPVWTSFYTSTDLDDND